MRKTLIIKLSSPILTVSLCNFMVSTLTLYLDWTWVEKEKKIKIQNKVV